MSGENGMQPEKEVVVTEETITISIVESSSIIEEINVVFADEFKQTLKAVCNEFNERLKLIMQGNNTNYKPLELGMPSYILLNAGLPDLPIQMSVQRLVDKKLQTNHPFKLVSIVHMPEYIANPLAVFQSKTRGDSKVIFTEMENDGVNIVAAIEMSKTSGKLEVNSVRSVYPKDNVKEILQWVAENNLMEYAHKKNFLNWLSKQQSNSADVTRLIKDSTKVVNNFENPTIKGEKN